MNDHRYDIAMAAGCDAGNRSMREAGRTAWNEQDKEVATEEFYRLMGREPVITQLP
jgi:hypothetical protein